MVWIWSMTNQQGYNDAIQYSFKDKNGEEFIVQFIVIASEIKFYETQKKV